jgi:hypothetical protein
MITPTATATAMTIINIVFEEVAFSSKITDGDSTNA